MSETLIFKKENGIARITLNRPEVFNSFNKEMALALQKALAECESDETIKVVILTGTGRAFSAGQDLNEITDPNKDFGLEEIVDKHFNPIVLAIYNLSKPVIAAVNGVAAGAGANIALLCDITVATESASFIQAFSKINLIPDSAGTYVLQRLVGFQKAIALALLGEKVSAKEADSMGMIYKCIADEDFESTVEKIASKLCAMPRQGIAYTKKLYNLGLHNDLESQLKLESKYQTLAGSTDDYHEAINAFIEKRKPIFTGK